MPPLRPPHPMRDNQDLVQQIERRLAVQDALSEYAPLSDPTRPQISAVMFLLSPSPGNGRPGGGDQRDGERSGGERSDGERSGGERSDGISLILNKRSAMVRQAGDLCCPGGGVTPVVDRVLAGLLKLPSTPLTNWPRWKRWRRRSPAQTQRLALLLGTALREGFEEMRLNPLGVRFLGPLPVERLVVFRKEIYPFVGWVGKQHRFRPNWEVEDLVYIPLGQLLEQANYARLVYRFDTKDPRLPQGVVGEMPCYLHAGAGGVEVLWGATFRITMRFLSLAFNFQPPAMAQLPVVHRDFDDTYVNGKG